MEDVLHYKLTRGPGDGNKDLGWYLAPATAWWDSQRKRSYTLYLYALVAFGAALLYFFVAAFSNRSAALMFLPTLALAAVGWELLSRSRRLGLWPFLRDYDWAFVDRTLRELLLRNEDRHRAYLAQSPEERGLAAASDYKELADDVEDPEYPFGQPRCRTWIIEYANTFLRGTLDAANLPADKLDAMLRTNWENDRRAVAVTSFIETPESIPEMAQRVGQAILNRMMTLAEVPETVNRAVMTLDTSRLSHDQVAQFRAILTTVLTEKICERLRG